MLSFYNLGGNCQNLKEVSPNRISLHFELAPLPPNFIFAKKPQGAYSRNYDSMTKGIQEKPCVVNSDVGEISWDFRIVHGSRKSRGSLIIPNPSPLCFKALCPA